MGGGGWDEAVTRKTEIHPVTKIRRNLPKSAKKHLQSASHYCYFFLIIIIIIVYIGFI